MEDNSRLYKPVSIEEQLEKVEQAAPETQFNSELAGQVARDAQKLIIGGISEAEFYQKHHQS